MLWERSLEPVSGSAHVACRFPQGLRKVCASVCASSGFMNRVDTEYPAPIIYMYILIYARAWTCCGARVAPKKAYQQQLPATRRSRKLAEASRKLAEASGTLAEAGGRFAEVGGSKRDVGGSSRKVRGSWRKVLPRPRLDGNGFTNQVFATRHVHVHVHVHV